MIKKLQEKNLKPKKRKSKVSQKTQKKKFKISKKKRWPN